MAEMRPEPREAGSWERGTENGGGERQRGMDSGRVGEGIRPPLRPSEPSECTCAPPSAPSSLPPCLEALESYALRTLALTYKYSPTNAQNPDSALWRNVLLQRYDDPRRAGGASFESKDVSWRERVQDRAFLERVFGSKLSTADYSATWTPPLSTILTATLPPIVQCADEGEVTSTLVSCCLCLWWTQDKGVDCRRRLAGIPLRIPDGWIRAKGACGWVRVDGAMNARTRC
jgi:hypothetical protein